MSEKRRRGRPRRNPESAATVRVVIRVTPAERAALERLARAERRLLGTVVRDAVNAYVADAGDELLFLCAGKSSVH